MRERAARANRWPWLIALAIAATACSSADPSDDADVDAGPIDGDVPDGDTGDAGDAAIDAPTCTVSLWDPEGDTMGNWPEPSIVIDDPSTRTGKRLQLAEGQFERLTSVDGFGRVFTEDLPRLDGFGVNSALYFRFGRPFSDLEALEELSSIEGTPAVGVMALDPGEPRLVPVTMSTTDDGATLLFTPLTALPPKGMAVSFATRGLVDAAGGCIEPSAALEALLDDPSEDVSNAIAALVGAGIIGDASDLIALSVFPTQSTYDESVRAAEILAERDYELDEGTSCETQALYIRCEAMLEAVDFRGDDGTFVIPEEGSPELATYRLPVSFFLPKTGEGPFPTILYGHGLGSGRDQATRLAEFAAPMGVATAAIDAPQHAQHPTTPAGASLELVPTVIRFFAIGDLGMISVRPRVLRDNFRGAAYDKLQLTHLLSTGPDIDGDDVPDIDPERLAYLGVSLGGIMGPELLALTDDFDAGVLVVAGGRVASIVSDSVMFGGAVRALRPSGTTPGDVDRFFPVLQTLIDRADAASYAPYILRDRQFDGAPRPPSVLMGIALDDQIVPNVSNYALARAFPLEIVQPVLREERLVEEGPEPPIASNIDDNVTAGLLQFDVIDQGGEIIKAGHDNMPASDVGVTAWLHFLTTAWEGEAEIIDPYAEVGLEHQEL